MKLVKILFLLISINFVYANLSENAKYESDLRTLLLKTYDKTQRPKDKITAYLTLYARQLISMDEKNQIMTSSSYFCMRWYDRRFEWAPSDHGGLKKIHIPLTSMWYPDMFIINSADSNAFLLVTSYNQAKVEYNGFIYVVLSAINLRTRCQMNVRNFPFDTQKCPITISSWSQTSEHVEFDNEGTQGRINNKSYTPNQIWELKNISIEVTKSHDRYIFDDSPSEELSYIFTLKRYPMYYMVTGIFPCLVLNLVTILSYSLPFSIQVGLSMTSFLTFSVYSLRVAGDIPVQSQYLPLIIIYFLFSVTYTLLSLIWFIIAEFFQSKSKMPVWLKKFSAILRKFRNTLTSCNCKKSEKVFTIKTSTPRIVVDHTQNEKVSITEETNNLNTITQRIISSARINDNIISPIPIDGDKIKESRCQKCGTCDKCIAGEQKDNEKKKNKDKIIDDVKYLNYFMSFLMVLFIAVTNFVLWFLIGD